LSEIKPVWSIQIAHNEGEHFSFGLGRAESICPQSYSLSHFPMDGFEVYIYSGALFSQVSRITIMYDDTREELQIVAIGRRWGVEDANTCESVRYCLAGRDTTKLFPLLYIGYKAQTFQVTD
jgi:hypothetical protein